MKVAGLLVALLFQATVATVFFSEDFSDGDTWTERWVNSKSKGADQGEFKRTAGKFYNEADNEQGIQTSQDAKFYGLTAKFDTFSNEGKDLVLQFRVKHEQDIDCGGGYIKLLNGDFEGESFNGDTPYNIMFGPDICGPGTKRVHVIFNYKGKNLLIKKEIRCKDDVLSHVYTLVVHPDNKYEVYIDFEKVESGDLEADWDFLPAKLIKDPDAKKPDDWDERENIDDEADVKPEGYEKPEHIPDPDAKKPEDWDEEMDGEWEPPSIDNPEYKGEWKPKQIPNPAYKGKWVHPEIENPEYSADDKLYLHKESGAVAFDLWQVKAGTIFSDIIVSDDWEATKASSEERFKEIAAGEKKMKETADEEQRKKDEEEAAKATPPEEENDEEEAPEEDETPPEDDGEEDAKSDL